MARSLRCPKSAALFFIGALALGCGDEATPAPAPMRDCPRAIWARPSRPGAEIRVIGSWNAWQEPGTLLPARGDGWHTARLDVPEGEYGYLIAESGEKSIDTFEPLTTFRGGEEVSLLRVPACDAPEIRVDEVEPHAAARDAFSPYQARAHQGKSTIRATFLRGASGAALRPSSVEVVRDRSAALSAALLEVSVERADARTGTIVVAIAGLSRGNHVVILAAADEAGQKTEQRVSLFVEPRAAAPEDAVIYQIFTDRFRGSNGEPPSPPPSPAMRAGGTLDGVRAELEKGTFEALGATALWLTPPAPTPDETRIGRSGRLEDAYHGYWQLDSRTVDARLGGEEALDRLVEAAHRRGLRILIDIVPNHLYERHPRYLQHAKDGWFHEGADKCLCGIDEGCTWATEILHCSFTEYLPDYRFEHPDVMRLAAEDAAYWMERFHVDGVRIDAVPMMPRATTRRIVDALHGAVAPAPASFTLGEVFTGTDGFPTIQQYLGPGGLSSAFDFPLMWTMRDAIAGDRVGFAEVDAVLAHGEASIAGSGSLLARMLDNHDTSRFLSEAAGDGARHAWDDPPGDPPSDAPYQRLELGLALLFTLPGIPVVYYGDEIGLAGATDPDSRRVMPRVSDLSPRQAHVLDVTRKLGSLRASREVLRRGTHRTLRADRDTYAFTRSMTGGDAALVLLSKSTAKTTLTIDANTLPQGEYVDALTGEPATFASDATTSVTVPPLSFRIFVQAR
jgi:glycosidase